MSAFQTVLLIGVVVYAVVLGLAFAIEWRRERENRRIEREQWQRTKARVRLDVGRYVRRREERERERYGEAERG